MRNEGSNPEDFLDRVVAELLADESLGAPSEEPDAPRGGPVGGRREGRRARSSGGRAKPAVEWPKTLEATRASPSRSAAAAPIAGSLAPSERDRPIGRDRETPAAAWRGHAVAFALGAALSLLGVRLAERVPSAAPADPPKVAAPADFPPGPVTPAAAPRAASAGPPVDPSPTATTVHPPEAEREGELSTRAAPPAELERPQPTFFSVPSSGVVPVQPKPSPAKPAPAKAADPYAEVDPAVEAPREPGPPAAPKVPAADPYAQIEP
jgi:hypothetical protein